LYCYKKKIEKKSSERPQWGQRKKLCWYHFFVLERNFKNNLRLSAFAQIFTFILHCPNIAKCPWLLHPKLTSFEMPPCVECFVLLHSPIIIDIKKLEAILLKVQKNVTDDEMDDDIYTHEMSDFFSTAKLVIGCIFKMEGNSFTWMGEIELNKQYTKIGGLMNFLLDCLVENENDEICMFNFTTGHLQDRISSDI
jgi:hypothetical protein